MTLPPKLLAFLVSERLAGKYGHGIVQLAPKPDNPNTYFPWVAGIRRVCRCGLQLDTEVSMINHLIELEIWHDPPYRWENIMYWEK